MNRYTPVHSVENTFLSVIIQGLVKLRNYPEQKKDHYELGKPVDLSNASVFKFSHVAFAKLASHDCSVAVVKENMQQCRPTKQS